MSKPNMLGKNGVHDSIVELNTKKDGTAILTKAETDQLVNNCMKDIKAGCVQKSPSKSN